MENLVWRYNQYEKPQLYNPNNELFHSCGGKVGIKEDYWICKIHRKALVIKPDRWYCPILNCSNDVFIRKSYYVASENACIW
jgi:hypothetical protein